MMKNKPLDPTLKPKELTLKKIVEVEASQRSNISVPLEVSTMKTVSLGEFLTLEELSQIGDLAQRGNRAILHEDIERLIIKPNIYRIMMKLNQHIDSRQLAFSIAAAWPAQSNSIGFVK